MNGRPTKPLDSPRSAESESLIGTVVDGRYRLTGVLGRGGMATVFRAEHTTIKRPVALKLLRPSVGRLSDFEARFEREAYALGRLQHENCVAVVDYGRDGDVAYLVMDYVDGDPLSSVLETEERLDWRRALLLCRDVLAGLAAAHAEGIVHRDIKPQNVVVCAGGERERAKVLDFGIAKLLGSESDNKLTAVGTAIGTPTYISPEQAVGNDVDGRADLYSVSIMLYEMISGVAPYRSLEPMQVVFQHINAPIPYLSRDHDVPEELCRLVREGLAKDPSDRIATAAEYLARIDALLSAPQAQVAFDSEPTAPVNASAGVGLRAVGSVIAVIAVVAVIGWVSNSDDPEPASAVAPAPASAPASAPDVAPAPASAPDVAPAAAPEPSPTAAPATRLAAAARAHLSRGHHYTRKKWWSSAHKEYRAAIKIDPSLRSDPALIRNALKSLQSRRHPSAGMRFIERDIGKPAIPYLRAATKNTRSLNYSRRAARLLKRLEG